jgi:hypothetical protein
MAKTKAADDQIFVAWQAGCCEVDGTPYSWSKGARLRGDHPAVTHVGETAFVADGTPVNEWPSVMDHAVAQNPDWKPSDAHSARLPVTKYRAQMTVTAEIDGEKRRVRRGDLLEPNAPSWGSPRRRWSW